VAHAAPSPPLNRAASLDGVLGFERVGFEDGLARARFAVVDAVKQPYGLVHGGAYAALAESLCSEATFRAVHADAKVAVGQSNHTTFLRPVLEGTVHAEARARHRGRTTWVWDVDFTDDAGRLCATARVTLAVRDAPGGQVVEPVP
jgi:1,4-dihydroxy-2-naphthoyl-CoA hydrolase